MNVRERLANVSSTVKEARSSSSATQTDLPLAAALRMMLGQGRRWPASLALLSLLGGLLEAALLALVAQTAATLVGDTGTVELAFGPFDVSGSTEAVLMVAVVMAVARLVLQLPLAIVPARMVAGMARQIQADMLRAFSRASWSIRSREFEGHLQELMTNQAWQASQGAVGAANMLSAGCMLAALVIAALVISPIAAGAILVAATVLFFVLRPLSHLAAVASGDLGNAGLRLANGVSEAGRVAQEAEVLGAAEVQRARIENLVDGAYRYYFRAQMLSRLVPNIYQSLIYLVVVVGLIVMNNAGDEHAAVLGAVVLLLVRASIYGQQAQGGYLAVRQGMFYLQRLVDVTDGYRSEHRSVGENKLDSIDGISFENVTYAYGDSGDAVADLSFHIEGGETVGIVGPSGSGKSTAVQLLMRLRQPDVGRYLINGEPADEFRPVDWHRHVAYVPQEPKLLHASVVDNIRFFRDLDDDAVMRAARLARIHDDIVEWRDGYDTVIGPRADAISGGQQQRICIARALAAEPSLIVLDEPTSALDPRSESLLQESLRSLRGTVTLVIVAHRLSTLDICDRILVIVKGRLESAGKVDDIERNSAYFSNAVAARSESSEAGLL